MKENKKRLILKKAASIAIALLYIAVGAVLLIFPKTSLSVLMSVLGTLSVLLGIIKIICYFTEDIYCLAFQFDLGLGVLSVILGILFLWHPAFLLGALPFAIGVFVLLGGLFTAQTARDSKAFGISKWWVMLIPSALSVIFGLLLVFNPFKSAVAITAVIGIAVIISGTEKLIVALTATNKNNNRDKDGFIEVDFKDVE